MMLTSSRDMTVKVWRLDGDGAGSTTISLVQTLPGHTHSAWDCDFNEHYLVSSGQDRIVRVWAKTTEAMLNDGITMPWHKKWTLLDHHSGVRNLCIFRCQPKLCITGDILGDLRVWDLEAGELHHRVPDQEETSYFRQAKETPL